MAGFQCVRLDDGKGTFHKRWNYIVLPSTTRRMPKHEKDPDEKKGAIEGDKPGDETQGNPNAPALDKSGLPNDPVAITEDVVGANEDGTEG